jgi:phosphate-selective porin
MKRWLPRLAGLVLLAAATDAASSALAQTTAAPAESSAAAAPADAFQLSPRPTLRIGDVATIAVTARIQGDMHASDRTSSADFDVARRRIGLTGTVTRHLAFEVERELDDTGWRDVFVNVRTFRPAQVRAGRFKMPFSLDQLTGAGSLDFVSRSRAAELLAPGRSSGVALPGRVARHVVGYDAGVFTHDGDVARFGANPGGGVTLAARVTVRPRGTARRPGAWSDVEFGVAATGGDVSEGRNSLRGRTASKDVFFSPIFVKGRRLRVGGDLDWRPGPFGVRAEYLRADDERDHQGLAGERLPPLRGQGWYLSGVWAVAGRRAHATADNHLRFAGLAGLELAARVERLWFAAGAAADGEVRTARAADLPLAAERVWTVGANWTLNRLVRVQLNAVHEQLTDRARGAVTAGRGWSPVVRVQFAI